MEKVNIKLVSGGTIERPLVSAFESDNKKFVVFDQEQNGSMGLPIILVCKLEDNKLTKIVDTNEWSEAKECLKKIIANKEMTFIALDKEVPADEEYFTQLTLPIPSFEALKKAYTLPLNSSEEPKKEEEKLEEPVNMAMEEPVVEAPAVDNTPVVEETPAVEAPVSEPIKEEDVDDESIIDIPSFESIMKSLGETVDDDYEEVPEFVDNQEVFDKYKEPDQVVEVKDPVIDHTVETAKVEAPVVEDKKVEENNEPVINVQMANTEEDIFKDQKEAFMKACENMFDALAAKFKKELEDKKN